MVRLARVVYDLLLVNSACYEIGRLLCPEV